MRQDIHEGREDDLELGAGEAEATPSADAESSGVEPAAAAQGASEAGPAEIDYKDRWLRAEAELQNFRKRARRDTEEARRTAEEAVLLDLVAWLDDLERAIDAARSAGAASAWVEGVSLVQQKGREYLERQGVTPIDPAGQPFDPALHEAILEVDAPEDTPAGTVVQVIAKGYRRAGRALRAARVVVARSPGGGA